MGIASSWLMRFQPGQFPFPGLRDEKYMCEMEKSHKDGVPTFHALL